MWSLSIGDSHCRDLTVPAQALTLAAVCLWAVLGLSLLDTAVDHRKSANTLFLLLGDLQQLEPL